MTASAPADAAPTALTTLHSSGPASLSLRLATRADLELLCAFRAECGWGVEHVRDHLGEADYPMCVFLAPVGDGGEGGGAGGAGGGAEGKLVEIGMGGWILEAPGKASRADGWVRVSSLFISRRHQGGGYGGRALALLERGAVERFGARVITLDTAAYDCTISADGSRFDEDTRGEARNVKWYRRRGYEIYNGPEPRFQLPDQADKELKIMAVDMKKPAATVVAEA